MNANEVQNAAQPSRGLSKAGIAEDWDRGKYMFSRHIQVIPSPVLLAVRSQSSVCGTVRFSLTASLVGSLVVYTATSPKNTSLKHSWLLWKLQ